MPVLIADRWNALREDSTTDSEGNLHFTGKIVVTFFLDKPNNSLRTGLSRKLYVDQHNNNSGKLHKEEIKEKNGKKTFRYYKIVHEHQAVLDKVTKSSIGFKGWMFTVGNETVCLPTGRCETKNDDVVLESTSKETTDTSNTSNTSNTPKAKTVQVRTQSDDLLDKIFETSVNK